MNIEKPGSGRSRIESTAEGLRIFIPTQKGIVQIGILIFLCAWMGGWLIGEVMVFKALLAGKIPFEGRIFMTFWLTAWTVGGVFVAYIILWNFFGKEIITFSSNTLKLEKKVFNLGSGKLYSTSEIKALRVHNESMSPFSWGWSMQFYGIGSGKLAFDYGYKTIHFASGIDEAEARHIIEQLHNRGLSIRDS